MGVRYAFSGYEIYKLDEPMLQVGMPNSHKWAVGKAQGKLIEFVDAFRSYKAATNYIEAQTGEIELTAHEASVFKNAGGMEGFARARKMRMRAVALATEIRKPAKLMFEGETLYIAKPKEN